MGPHREKPPSPRWRQLTEAALAVIAEHGLRGLTHRAVDRRAGLPEGSCSAYLRTRSALQVALAQHVAAQLTEDVREAAADLVEHAGDHDFAVGRIARLFLGWLEARDVLVARLELSLEATRDAGLAAVLRPGRAELVEVVDGVLRATDRPHSPSRADVLVSSLDGILIEALFRTPAERRDYLAESVGLVLEPAT